MALVRALGARGVISIPNFRCPKFSKFRKKFGNFRVAIARLQTQMWDTVHLSNRLQGTWEGCFEALVRALGAHAESSACQIFGVRNFQNSGKISEIFGLPSRDFKPRWGTLCIFPTDFKALGKAASRRSRELWAHAGSSARQIFGVRNFQTRRRRKRRTRHQKGRARAWGYACGGRVRQKRRAHSDSRARPFWCRVRRSAGWFSVTRNLGGLRSCLGKLILMRLIRFL